MFLHCFRMGKCRHSTQRYHESWVLWCGLYPTTSMWSWPGPFLALSPSLTVFGFALACTSCVTVRGKKQMQVYPGRIVWYSLCAIRSKKHVFITEYFLCRSSLIKIIQVNTSFNQVTYKSWSTWTSGLSGTPEDAVVCEGAEIRLLYLFVYHFFYIKLDLTLS